MTTRLVLLPVLAAALAVSLPAAAEDAPPAAAEERMYLGLEPLETCLKRWDPDTNMSKEEWRASCERISNERGKYIKERGIGQPE